MSRLRIIYLTSLAVLAVLTIFTVFRPMATGGEYRNVARTHLLQTDNEYIIEFDIINHEGEDKKYTINVVVNSKLYSEDALILSGRMFTYIHHIRPEKLTEGNVHFAIYKEGEDIPFKQATYYLK